MLNEDIFDLSKSDDDAPEHIDAELISSPEEFEAMSLTVEKQNKEHIANLKKKMTLALDRKKLSEALKNFEFIEFVSSIYSDPAVQKRVRDNVNTAQDLKFLSDAQSKAIENQQKLMRMDSLDGAGTAKRISIGVRYQDDSGTNVETVIKAGD